MIVVSVLRSSSNGPGARGGIEDDGERLDIECDQVDGVLGDIGIGGEYGGDRLADITHGALRQCALPVGLERGQAGQPEADRRDVRDVVMRPHRVHAGQRQRRRSVDRC